MVSPWRNFKNIFPRPLFIIIFRPEMLKFHPYSILTGDTRVEIVIYCVLSTLVRPFSICSHLLPIWNWGDFLKCYVVIVSLSVNSAVVLRVRFLQLVRLYLRVPLIWLLHCNYYTHHHDPFLIWNCSRFFSLKSFSVLCMLKLKDANSMTPYNNALAKSICTH